MFGYFKKLAVLNGAIGALKQVGLQREQRDLLTSIIMDSDLLGGISIIKIPQRLKSVIVSNLSLTLAMNQKALDSYLCRDQYSMLRQAVGIQITMCTDNEKQRATGFLVVMLSRIFNEDVTLQEVKEMYQL
tara:strand:- start:95 stop:487 length:393 start_codon:yes stop_codon:yes gene_type:complete